MLVGHGLECGAGLVDLVYEEAKSVVIVVRLSHSHHNEHTCIRPVTHPMMEFPYMHPTQSAVARVAGNALGPASSMDGDST